MRMGIRKLSVAVLILLVALSVGCGGEETAASPESLDVAGEYSSTMTFTKVEVVYDTDDEERYYQPEEPSDYRTDNNEFVYTMPGEEGFDDTVLSLKFYEEGTIVKAKGTIVQTHSETGWVNELTLELTKADS